MQAIYKRVAGLDVHRVKNVATVLIEEDEGELAKATREFGGFKRDMRLLVEWLLAQEVELVVMRSAPWFMLGTVRMCVVCIVIAG